MFCMCWVVFRECAQATQVVDLASAELYMYLEAAECELWWIYMYYELYWRAILESYLYVIGALLGSSLMWTVVIIYVNGDYEGGC